MSFCSNCGKELSADTRFCPECGTPVIKSQTQKQVQRQQVYEGDIRKCPNCGEVLSAFEITCHACGFELRNRQGSNAVRDLADSIAKLEENRPREVQKETNSVFKYTLPSADPVDKSIANTIKSFVIPNTKEDILEFLILAANSIDADAFDSGIKNTSEGLSQNLIATAWLTKFEQAYHKAKLTFGSSPEFNEVQELYDEKKKEISRRRYHTLKFLFLLLLGMIVFYAAVMAIYTTFGNSQKKPDKNSESMKEEIQEIQKGVQDYQDKVKEYTDMFTEVFENSKKANEGG